MPRNIHHLGDMNNRYEAKILMDGMMDGNPQYIHQQGDVSTLPQIYLEPVNVLYFGVNEPSKTRPFLIKIRVIWVVGIHIYIYIET